MGKTTNFINQIKFKASNMVYLSVDTIFCNKKNGFRSKYRYRRQS